MGFFKRVACVGVFSLVVPALAMAEEEEEKAPWYGEVSGNVGVVSDYSFRGVSQTGREAALQGGIDWSHWTGLYVGTWGSSVDFGDDAYLEQDFYAGIAREFGGVSVDVGAIFYYYPPSEALNYWEFLLGLGYDFGVFSVSTGFVGSPDLYKVGSEGFVVPAGIAAPIPVDFPVDGFELSADANANYTWLGDTEDVIINGKDSYADWNVGLVLGTPLGISLDMRYVGTSEADDVHDAGHRFIFGGFYEF